jgi:hypothetical protein
METTKGTKTTKPAAFGNTLLAAVVHFFKLRWTAKRFNIWKAELDPNDREGYWIGYDGIIYYGYPLGVFIYSSQNRWWLDNGC